jgi:hypothetical protein
MFRPVSLQNQAFHLLNFVYQNIGKNGALTFGAVEGLGLIERKSPGP